MGYFIGAGTVGVIGLAIFFISILLRNEGIKFNQNKRVGRAIVTGYDGTDAENGYDLMVKIPDLNDGKVHICITGNINIKHYPIGSEIDVLYAPFKAAGISRLEVRLLASPPADSIKVAELIKKFAVALLVISSILAVIGIVILL